MGKVCISAHSGGYKAAARAAEFGQFPIQRSTCSTPVRGGQRLRRLARGGPRPARRGELETTTKAREPLPPRNGGEAERFAPATARPAGDPVPGRAKRRAPVATSAPGGRGALRGDPSQTLEDHLPQRPKRLSLRLKSPPTPRAGRPVVRARPRPETSTRETVVERKQARRRARSPALGGGLGSGSFVARGA